MIVVVDVELIQCGGRGNRSVSIDRHRLEGQGDGAALGYIGAAEILQSQGGIVHLAVDHRIAQRLSIDLSPAGLGGHQVGKETGAALSGHGSPLLQADPVPQAQRRRFAQLGAGEGASQRCGIIA